MSPWQIGMSIIAGVYALILLYTAIATIRQLRGPVETGEVRTHCPPHVNCRLCRGDEARRASDHG